MNRRSIGDYALIGDCETAALVGKDGAVDWLCLPFFDSPACFARMLGGEQNGFWRIAPTAPVRRVSRRYLDDSLVLETQFETDSGVAALIDFMPARDYAANVVRIARGVAGQVEMQVDIDLRFDYGSIRPWMEDSDRGFYAVAGPAGAALYADVALHPSDGGRRARLRLAAGQSAAFVLTHFASYERPPPPIDAHRALADTLEEWREWSSRCRYQGPYRDAVIRSLLVLKALTHRRTGGVVAAPTSSLPESMLGERNWDYRYCWLRDATFLLLSLLQAGYVEEAVAWRNWLQRAGGGEFGLLQPLYGMAGERRIIEWEASWLPGFNGAAPVRFGNAAHSQFQLDVYGELLDALFQACMHGVSDVAQTWRLQREIVQHVLQAWTRKDAGIWEVRSPPQHFTHSKVMAWVGLERCIRFAEIYRVDGEVGLWRRTAERIRAEVMARGFNDEIGAFTRTYDSADLDASALLFPEVGFIDANDPRMLGTVRAIERELRFGPYVRRYSSEAEDGLTVSEGAFLPCSCWLADVYTLQGRHDEAEAIFRAVLDARNDVGLLSEEYDPDTGELLGNFPQALSHISLADTAFNLASARGPARVRGKRSEERAREERQ